MLKAFSDIGPDFVTARVGRFFIVPFLERVANTILVRSRRSLAFVGLGERGLPGSFGRSLILLYIISPAYQPLADKRRNLENSRDLLLVLLLVRGGCFVSATAAACNKTDDSENISDLPIRRIKSSSTRITTSPPPKES